MPRRARSDFISDDHPVNRPLSRRAALSAGASALSAGVVSAPSPVTAEQVAAMAGRNGKSVIFICLLGGPAQHETWDPKPDAPQEVRGEFGTVATSVPGLRVGELMPQTAALTDKLAVLRAVVTGDNAHSSSGYQMLTGVPHIPMNQENSTPQFPNRHPNFAAIVRHLQPQSSGLPSAVQLPLHIFNDGMITWPGQDAGWLGRPADPWLLTCDPSDESFQVPELRLPETMTTDRLQLRRQLQQSLSETAGSPTSSGEFRSANWGAYDHQVQTAYGLLHGANAAKAFDINAETPTVRERYGSTRFGQSLLLARRLVEAGTRVVQVNWTRLPDKVNNGTWDTHGEHGRSMKDWLMPIMDQSYSALIEDLSDRGLLEDTLVVWTGEFGRTPRHNARGGRDHWGRCFSLALAGGGIQGGQVLGESDKDAAYPVADIVRPPDLTATMFHVLGFDPAQELHDPLGRPLPLSRGRVLSELF